MRHRFSALCSGALLFALLPAQADDFFQILDTGTPASTERDAAFSHMVYLQQILKYGWQSPEAMAGHGREKAGIAQIKTHIFGEAQGKWSDHNGWQLSAQGENEWYEWQDNRAHWHSHNGELRLRDAFIDITTKNGSWMRVGHQILAWGQSEGLVITDVLSPQDLSEPLQAELRDIREQVPALLLSTPVLSNSKLMAAFTYKAGSHRFAGEGEAFDFFAPYRQLGLQFVERDPHTDWEAAIRWESQFNGGDLYLMSARVNDNNLSLGALDASHAYLDQRRQTITGLGANRALGNWLLKTEIAHWRHVPVATKTPEPWPLHNQTRAMAGLEYSGWSNTSLNIEINHSHTHDHADNLTQSADTTGYVVRLRHSAWNDRVTQQFWWIKLAAEDTQVGRWDLSFDWNDHWTFNLGAVTYTVNSATSLFWPVRYEDSLNFSVHYAF